MQSGHEREDNALSHKRREDAEAEKDYWVEHEDDEDATN